MREKFTFLILLMSFMIKAQMTLETKPDSIHLNDYEYVLNSVDRSEEIRSMLSNFNNHVLLKTINGNNVYDIPNNISSSKIMFYTAREISDNNIEDFIELDCVIFYSTFEVKYTFTDSNNHKSITFYIKYN